MVKHTTSLLALCLAACGSNDSAAPAPEAAGAPTQQAQAPTEILKAGTITVSVNGGPREQYDVVHCELNEARQQAAIEGKAENGNRMVILAETGAFGSEGNSPTEGVRWQSDVRETHLQVRGHTATADAPSPASPSSPAGILVP